MLSQVDPSRYYWRCVSDMCSAFESHAFKTAEEQQTEADAVLCNHLYSYSDACAARDVRFDWRTNSLCRKYKTAWRK